MVIRDICYIFTYTIYIVHETSL